MEKRSAEARLSHSFDVKIIPGKSEPKMIEYGTKIKNFISKLDDNISIIIKGHETDFLSAYKTIMNQIQIQMSKLRQTSDEQVVMVKNDQAVKNLQGSLVWYQNEAVKLSDACSRLQARYDKVREKIRNFTTENAYLEQQTKLLIRQNQTLKNNLTRESTEESIQIKQIEGVKFSQVVENIRYQFNVKNTDLLKSLQRVFDKNEAADEEKIRQVDLEIKEIQGKIKEIAIVQSQMYLRRNESEELFLECVDEMRKEIIRKRAKTYSIKRAGTSKQTNMMMSEREKLIESFVANEDTISFLYEKLFPWKNDQSSKDMLVMGGTMASKFDDFSSKKSESSRSSNSSKQPIVVKGKLLISG